MKSLLFGFDLGTQSGKAVLMDLGGDLRAVARREYPILSPKPGAAEQNPDDWWRAFCECTHELLDGSERRAGKIVAIGLSGQMHGLVPVDGAGRPVRPAIIWADTRGAAAGAELVRRVGEQRFAEVTRNRAPAGFLGPTALWMREGEPEAFRAARTLFLPKDYLRYRLTGKRATEPTDACATALFDVANRRWSHEVLRAAELDPSLLPLVSDSCEVVGRVTPQAAKATGLRVGTPVIAGGGDQPCAAIGNGILNPGRVLLTIGTGGQLFAPTDRPAYDEQLRTHTFCHVRPDRWYVMGATLAAGLSLRWFRDALGSGSDYDTLMSEAEGIEPGAAGVIYLPHLIGERTPHFDPGATGAFAGLSLSHHRGHLARAILEGVALSQRACLEIIVSLGIRVEEMVFTGGAAQSALWRQVVADVLGRPLWLTAGEEHAACGAAMLAGVGVGVFPDLDAACRSVVRGKFACQPDGELKELYDGRYRLFEHLYRELAPLGVTQ